MEKHEGFQVKEGYGLIFCKESGTIRWFKKGETHFDGHWSQTKKGKYIFHDDKLITPYVKDRESMRQFMFEMQRMFSGKWLGVKELELNDYVIAFVYYEMN